jgi:DNA-binding transcriptional LysR family regulator
LSLALVGSLANARLTGALRRFTRRFPKVRLDVQTANSAEVSDLVRRGAATLGLRYVVDGSPELCSREIARERLVVVANPRHRLADGRRHKAKDLTGERWVAFPSQRSRESFVRFLDRKLLAVGLDGAEIVPIDSLTAQKRLVEAGFGVALLAESGVEEELRVGALKRLNVPELRASIAVALVHRRTGYLSTAAHELISTIATSLA